MPEIRLTEELARRFMVVDYDTYFPLDGVRQMKGKDAPWVTEDQGAVLDQLTWLNGLSRTAPHLAGVASHEEQHAELIQKGILANRLE